MEFGLTDRDIGEIIGALRRFDAVEEAVIFGSRAKGDHKNGSDVDIAVKGEKIDHAVVSSLAFALNENSSSPYYFDIVHYDALADPELIAHIDRVGKRVYSRRCRERRQDAP